MRCRDRNGHACPRGRARTLLAPRSVAKARKEGLAEYALKRANSAQLPQIEIPSREPRNRRHAHAKQTVDKCHGRARQRRQPLCPLEVARYHNNGQRCTDTRQGQVASPAISAGAPANRPHAIARHTGLRVTRAARAGPGGCWHPRPRPCALASRMACRKPASARASAAALRRAALRAANKSPLNTSVEPPLCGDGSPQRNQHSAVEAHPPLDPGRAAFAQGR